MDRQQCRLLQLPTPCYPLSSSLLRTAAPEAGRSAPATGTAVSALSLSAAPLSADWLSLTTLIISDLAGGLTVAHLPSSMGVGGSSPQAQAVAVAAGPAAPLPPACALCVLPGSGGGGEDAGSARVVFAGCAAGGSAVLALPPAAASPQLPNHPLVIEARALRRLAGDARGYPSGCGSGCGRVSAAVSVSWPGGSAEQQLVVVSGAPLASVISRGVRCVFSSQAPAIRAWIC